MRKEIFALKCSKIGVIDEVLFNNSDQIEIIVGQKFIGLFDEATYEQAQSFFLESKKTNKSSFFESELFIHTKHDSCLLFFKSLAVEDYFLIIAEEEESDYYNLFDSLTKINSELILTQKNLNKMNKELLEVNELKNRLVGITAHDLRNPIAIIHSYSDLLLEDCKGIVDEDNFEFIENINTTAKFMLGLVEDLLDLTYLESGKVILKLEETNFSHIFDTNIKYAIILGNKKNIIIQASKQSKDILVRVDKNKIQQVISNFISNAIKYSHPNSTVTIACETNSKSLIFSCKDEGFGIDKSEFDTIFEPFKKAKSSQYIEEQSTGLGLAISNQIIKAHSGKIWLESEVDKGSTFYFSLPLGKE